MKPLALSLGMGLIRVALVASMLIPAAALAGGPGYGAGGGSARFGHSRGGHGASPYAGYSRSSTGYGSATSSREQGMRRIRAITLRRRFQERLNASENRDRIGRQIEASMLRRSGSQADVLRFARRARLENAIEDQVLREDLRRDLLSRRVLRLHAADRSWIRPGPSSYRRLEDALERRRLRRDRALQRLTEDLARDIAWPERPDPQLREAAPSANPMERVLSFMGY